MSIKSTSKTVFKLVDKQQFSEYIRDLAWSPKGDYLIIASAGGELAGWQEKNLYSLLPQGNFSLDCVSFSADGQFFAVAGQEGQVEIWQCIETSKTFINITTINEGQAWIDSLAWNSQQNLLAFAFNREIKIWDSQSQEILVSLNFEDSSVFGLAWHPQGNLLAVSGNNGVKIWQTSDWKQKPEQLEVPGASLTCSWSADGKYLASGNLDRTISLLQWQNPPPWLMQGFPAKVNQVAWSQNSAQPFLASICKEAVVIWQFDRKSKNWQNQVLPHEGKVEAIAFSPNSSLLASASDDGCIKIWQQGKKLIKTLKGKTGFSCLAWHPTGKYLAVGGQNGELTIWQNFLTGQGFGNN